MIGVEGHWIVFLSLNGRIMNIPPLDFYSFVVIEEAGNLLPTWRIDFAASDYKFAQNWNEGASLEVSWGRTRDTLVKTKLRIVNPSYSREGDNRIRYRGTGIYDSLAYVNTAHIRCLPGTSAVEAIKGLVTPYFQWDPNNVNSSMDTQAYLQPNISDKRFVDHLAKHAYLGKESYFGTAIVSDGRFRAVDAVQALSAEPKYNLGLRVSSGPGKFLLLLGPPEYQSNSSIGNTLVGYGTEKTMVDTALGHRVTHKPTPVITAAQATQTPRSEEVERRSAPPVRLSTTHDRNYHVAASNNYMRLMNLSNNTATVVFEAGFEPISVWDTVYLSDIPTGTPGSIDDIRSGKYVVGLVSRQITGLGQNRFLTKAILMRESTNQIRGNLHA